MNNTPENGDEKNPQNTPENGDEKNPKNSNTANPKQPLPSDGVSEATTVGDARHLGANITFPKIAPAVLSGIIETISKENRLFTANITSPKINTAFFSSFCKNLPKLEINTPYLSGNHEETYKDRHLYLESLRIPDDVHSGSIDVHSGSIYEEIREEIRAAIRAAIREEIRAAIREEILPAIREEILPAIREEIRAAFPEDKPHSREE